jgi:transcription-repair coupling factor (superfamily II helicase)
MLSKNVQFRDLGLLIIDEEQRFGVVQKEKLREMAKNVDTLILSATPIPRTLNMSMSGINDISVLDEAPGERRPVQTYVLEHDDEIIIDALRRELARGGQTLYLYNKIEDIDLVAGRIGEALPEARVTYAHGQMEKEELEDIWQMLVRGEIDILVCTTIIETGVDLPNANTLVIENAERFGLSQLHQIRGRVGRSERQAYAYFTYKRGKHLNEVAEKRLAAIKEFAEFGAGFKIALRDLEIRGAGNLLGAEQHGYIESVGYDLYIKLLNEAVLEERGEKREERSEAHIVMGVSAHIPEYYIKSSAARMEMYKKISFIESKDERDDLYDEMTDRFGDVPVTVTRLLDVALTKALASKAKIKKIEHSGLRLTFVTEKPDLGVWSELFAKHRELSFVGLGSPLIVYRLRKDEDPTAAAVKVMCDYDSVMRSDQ